MPSYFDLNPLDNARNDAEVEMYAHLLNQVQGVFGSDYQIDMSLELDPADVSKYNHGVALYIDPTTNLFKVGMVAGYLPFLAAPAGGYEGLAPFGNAYAREKLGLPVCVGYRVQTTEFLSTDTYPANVPLTANASTGILQKGAYYNETILGIVVKDVASEAGRSVLEFITYFLPPLDAGSVIA